MPQVRPQQGGAHRWHSGDGVVLDPISIEKMERRLRYLNRLQLSIGPDGNGKWSYTASATNMRTAVHAATEGNYLHIMDGTQVVNATQANKMMFRHSELYRAGRPGKKSRMELKFVTYVAPR